jgi:acetylglutamate kinase
MPPTAPRPIVVKIGGAVCAEPTTLAAFAAAWRGRGSDAPPIILVHGGGPQLDKALLALGEPVVKVNGLRVTSPTAAGTVRETMDGIGAEVAAGLREHGLPAIHIPATKRLLAAEVKKLPDGADLGRVGTVRAFDAAALEAMLTPGQLAVVTPVGWDDDGPLNVNADEGASSVARALHAQRLVLATDVAYVLDAAGNPVQTLDGDGVREFLTGPAAKGGMVPKLRAALEALDTGVHEVCIGKLEGAWSGTGTRIMARVGAA